MHDTDHFKYLCVSNKNQQSMHVETISSTTRFTMAFPDKSIDSVIFDYVVYNRSIIL
jgi:hypothetical protein